MRNLLILSIALLLVGGGCAGSSAPTSEPWSLSPLQYTLPADGKISVTTETILPDGTDASLIDAETLYTQAEECGYARDASYYLDLERLFAGTAQQRYTFTIAGDYEMPTWTVTLAPNVPAYGTLESFKQDFDICAAGGTLYPTAVSASTLLFAGSCGSGYSAGKENGCDVIRTAVAPTLKID